MSQSLVMALAVASCATGADQPLRRSRFLMGTVCDITVPDAPPARAAVDAAFDEIERVERLLSTWRDDSELARLNAAPAGAAVSLSPELFDLLRQADSWSKATGGAFSPLVGRLVALWGFRGEPRRPPEPERIAARDAIAAAVVTFGPVNSAVSRPAGVTFEEGGFGKGYALDRAVNLLRGRGVRSGVIDFGGQIAAFGDPAAVTIAHPEKRHSAVVELALKDASLSTSSAAEATFEAGGERLSHLIDPRTGLAVRARGSVSVVHESAFVADILSTALYVLGERDGASWAATHGVAALFLVPDQPSGHFRLVATPAFDRLASSLTVVSPEIKQ